MAAPMALIEIARICSMYPNARLNGVIILATLLVMILCWVFIRQQTAISDNQFVRSMIPHHAGAVLMCEENQLKDPDLVQLCQEIISSQQAEILLMKSKLGQE